MQGYNVLHCNGFDAFGLPAENAAIKRNIPPADWTRQNIASMTKQLEAIGASYDWDRKLVTSEAEYYRWTQWLFLKLYEKGQAYRKKGLVNWCPKDQTVLANEQTVGEDGTKNVCVRCGTPIEQKELEQWYFKITDYADRLLEDAKDLDMPERVKTMQENWIGKSVGAEVDFGLDFGDPEANKRTGPDGKKAHIPVYTTRPDTLFGATYLVLAPEHKWVELALGHKTVLKNNDEVAAYVEQAKQKTELDRKEGEKDKTGVEIKGVVAINPVNSEKIPIWIADYVLTGYGTGAIMAVPAHDERDFEFAKKFGLTITEVIEKPKDYEGCYTGEGKMINSGNYNGISSQEMREKIVADLSKKDIATEQINYRLRDWLISRQRYWGAPIPIIYCDDCGIVPVPEEQLPVKLPEDVEFMPTGQSPLISRQDFVKADCPKCGRAAKRETDTMDTFVDSSWYFLRYPDPAYKKAAFNPAIVNEWGPLDHYVGGIEHAILHLLYARYITKFLHDHHDLAFNEPFKKLSNQGIILGPDGDKMSKSKGNVVSPDEQVGSYGADSLRLYLMFMGPYDQGGPYSFGGIAGVRRFLDRFWNLIQEFLEPTDKAKQSNGNTELATTLHKTIKKVSEDLNGLRFNTAISGLMEAVNDLYKIKAQDGFSGDWKPVLAQITQLLAPFAPHVSEEIWQQLEQNGSIHLSSWPVHDEKYLAQNEITIVVQINGKVRANLKVPAGSSEEEIVDAAKADEKVVPYLKEKEARKIIYVPQKLVNFVV